MAVEPIGLYQMLLVAGGLLAACALLSQVVHVRESRKKTTDGALDEAATPSDDEKKSTDSSQQEGAFEMVFKHRYLTLLAAFSLVFTLVNTNGEYILGRLIQADAFQQAADRVTDEELAAFWKQPGADDKVRTAYNADPADFDGLPLSEVKDDVARSLIAEPMVGPLIGKTFGDFFSYVNLLSLFMQLFLVSRIVKYFGLGRAFFILPVIALFDAAAVVAIPAFYVLRVGKTLENATDYSLNNTLRNMLWLPTTSEMKYRAKQAVDSFFVRMGDTTSAVLVLISATLGLSIQAFAATNAVLCIAWLVLAAAIVAENRRLSR